MAPDKPPRDRDQLFDAVAEACGVNVAELTKTARGALNGAVKQLRDIDAIPGQVKVRAARYRRQYADASLTPTALVKHWATLGEAREPRAVGDFGPEINTWTPETPA